MSFPENRRGIQKLKPFWYQALGEVSGFAADSLYNLHISSETLANTETLRQHLKDGSVLAYVNHICLDDAPLVCIYYLRELGSSIREMGGPASKKHYDGREGWGNAFVLRLARSLGIKLIPLVQHYDEEFYDEDITFVSRSEFIRTAKESLNNQGTLLILAPEGTRSVSKSLKLGQGGVGLLAKLLKKNSKKTLFAPTAFIPPDSYKREQLNLQLLKKKQGCFEIKVGEPFFLEDSLLKADRREITNLLMRRLAVLLPEEMRGVYL